jgi:hypothetical protein
VSGFQLLGLGLLLGLLALTVRAGVRGRTTRRAAAAWSGLWISAAVAIAEPRTTVWLADLLGIGRGADLVLYCAVLGMGVGFFLVYARLRQIESGLTRIVRHAALRDAIPAESPESGPTPRGGPTP